MTATDTYFNKWIVKQLVKQGDYYSKLFGEYKINLYISLSKGST
jgi:hypothetical protein